MPRQCLIPVATAIAAVVLLAAAIGPAHAQQPDAPERVPVPPAKNAPDAPAVTPAAQEAVAPRAPARRTYTFQVILLRARAGEPRLPDLPEGALDALRDLQGLTRFRDFEVLDTAWLRTQRAARARLGEAGAFEVYLALGHPQPPPAPEAGSEEGPERAGGLARYRPDGEPGAPARIIVEHFEVVYWRWDKREDGRIYYSEDPVDLVTSTFGLELGETAVVATSRLTDGDEALVVLVKAME